MSTRGGNGGQARARTGTGAAGAATRTPKAPSNTARQNAAVSRAAAQLGHEAGTLDAAAVRTALLEAAAERLASDEAFARSVRERLASVQSVMPKTSAKSGGPTAAGEAAPRPLGVSALGSLNPLARLDPYQLRENYGAGQLRAVLSRATAVLLKQAVSVVQERNPGTKPTSLASKAAMIDYIVAHVPAE